MSLQPERRRSLSAGNTPERPLFKLDTWKGVYSNSETRPTAIAWFWDNFDPITHSVWEVVYLYPEELTLTFMSANMVGGFFQGITAKRSLCFGSLAVYGTDNDNAIRGYFIFKGQECLVDGGSAFAFTKVDVQSVKADFEASLAWDGPGFVDGKTFK